MLRLNFKQANAFLLLLPLFLIETAQAGSGSHGGDTLASDDNPWALARRSGQVEYCIERDADYDFSNAELQDLIEESVSDWAVFFRKPWLNNGTFNRGAQGKLTLMSFNFSYIENCNNPKDQITFIFGARRFEKSEATALLLSSGYPSQNNMPGAAIPYSNEKIGGVVWVAKDDYTIGSFKPVANNSRKQRLLGVKHILLHELGHVFGMPHDSVFVMDSSVGAKIGVHGHAEKSLYLAKIEAPNWRYDLWSGMEVLRTPITVEASKLLGVQYSASLFLVIKLFDLEEAKPIKRWQLAVVDKSGGLGKSIEGEFKVIEQGEKGPSLYSAKNGKAFYLHLDTRKHVSKIRGRFLDGNLSMAAQLDLLKVPKLQLVNGLTADWIDITADEWE